MGEIMELNRTIEATPQAAPPALRPGPRRVMLIVESSSGGTGRHVLDLAEGLLQRGCEVHLAWSTRRVDAMFRTRLATLPQLHQLPLPIRTAPHPGDMGIVWKLRRHLRRHGPFDILHGHSSKGGALARLAALGTSARAVYTLHGLIMMDPGLGRAKKLIYSAVEGVLALRTAGIIAVSPEEARAAVRQGLPRVSLIPNGVDEPNLTPRSTARQAMGVDKDQIVVGFIGRLVEQK